MPLTGIPRLSSTVPRSRGRHYGTNDAFHLVGLTPRRFLDARRRCADACAGESVRPSTLGKKSRPRMNTRAQDNTQKPKNSPAKRTAPRENFREDNRVAAANFFKSAHRNAAITRAGAKLGGAPTFRRRMVHQQTSRGVGQPVCATGYTTPASRNTTASARGANK